MRRSSSSAASSSDPSTLPLDPLERPERRLDRGPLARARRSTSAASPAAPAPCRRRARCRSGRGRGRRPARSVHRRRARAWSGAGAPRSGELDEIADRARPALLGEAQQRDQDLRRREGVRERPVARLDGHAEEVRERCEREALAPVRRGGAAPARPCRGPQRRTRRPVRRSTSRSRNAMSKRALWATSGASPANARNRRRAISVRGAPRRSAARIPVSVAIEGGSAVPGLTSVSNVSTTSSS